MNLLLRFPARRTLPLLLILASLLTALGIFALEWREISTDVEREARESLRERLAIEQTRLEIQLGQGNILLVRRIVASLGLRPDISHAWLIGPDQRVFAALSRFEIGLPWEEIRRRLPPRVSAVLQEACPGAMPLTLCRSASADFLRADLRLASGHRLIVVSDLATKRATRFTGEWKAFTAQIAAVFLFVLLLWYFLRQLWGKRIQTLERAVQNLGRGDFSARATLPGADEIAHIGAAFDQMAERLASQQEEIRRLASLIEQSPLVAIVWRNAPGWPVDFVSDNIVRWGFSKLALLAGKIVYADLIHPDDLPAISADVEAHLAHGPDRYVQVYRLRDGFGHWRWIEDHTWLLRDAEGRVATIQGILIDISSRREAEARERHQAEELAKRNTELERFVAAAIGREEEMVRLKRMINALCREFGRPAPFDLASLDEKIDEPPR